MGSNSFSHLHCLPTIHRLGSLCLNRNIKLETVKSVANFFFRITHLNYRLEIMEVGMVDVKLYFIIIGRNQQSVVVQNIHLSLRRDA